MVVMYILILIVSLYSVYLIPSDVYGQQKTSDFLKVKNSILGVSINIPTDWVLVDQGIRKEDPSVGYILFQPHYSSVGSLSINVRNLSFNNMSISYYDQKYQQEDDRFFKINILENSNNTTLAGLPAHSRITNSPVGMGLKIWTLKNNKSYEVSFSSLDKNGFDQYLPVVKQMIDSFKIL